MLQLKMGEGSIKLTKFKENLETLRKHTLYLNKWKGILYS